MISNLLNQTMVVDRLTATIDASGGQTVNYATRIGTNVSCRVNPISQEDLQIYAQQSINVSHSIYSLIQRWMANDRILLTDGRVLFVKAFRTHYAIGTMGEYSVAYADEQVVR